MSEHDSSIRRRELLGAVALGLAALPAASAVAAGTAKAPAAGAAKTTAPAAGPAKTAAPAPAKKGSAKPFVLVHGAWHGGWSWTKLRPLLEQAGHPVFTPTLTGLGDRSHLLHKGIDLSTHVTDVIQLLEFEDLHDVILVGHSYAGMVVTGVAAQAAERLDRIVYLDAFVPRTGMASFDNLPPEARQGWTKVAAEKGDGWRLPPLLSAKDMGVTDPKDVAWLEPRLRPMPLAAFEQPLVFDEAKVARLKRNYLRCKGFPGTEPIAAQLTKQGWDVQVLDAGHDVMVAAPAELAKALLSRV